jgi:DNA-3-methyladenine glycosylase
MRKRLNRKFFARDAETVARELLGKVLVRKFPDGTRKEGIIVETEAYVGAEDIASHASQGRRTKRNEVMYGPPGRAYVYFTYGLHWLLNAVTAAVDDPQAVLIRGLDITSGPARLTKLLQIGGDFNGEDLVKSKELYLEDRGIKVKDSEVEITPRVGVDYAREWKDKPLRFVLKDLD